eukprot:CAMPEP_0170468568 /NCGR_PEP_ID=MMETSP0123-20130129/11698_1 /TAXON_ID=182087 /ORGANISM="Favella ehrenbergii, Strain Fehren 1" /LENGTH=75 /DNA_ID=CAMNT_0010735167 /DNA_START=402 /DNA_END=629 /DNA_ORIENTATION=+
MQLSDEPGFQSFEELMSEIKTKYWEEKKEVDQAVMMTLRQQKNRMKDLECGIEYPQNFLSSGAPTAAVPSGQVLP